MEAFLLLGIARAAVLVLPFKSLSPYLGQSGVETPHEDQSDRELLQSTSWAIHKAVRYTPWNSNCLAQAIAGRYLLKRRGISATIYCGVARQPEGNLTAHAWLRSGSTDVSGGEIKDGYRITGVFGTVAKSTRTEGAVF